MNKLSRNDACWCGSGIKYKKCHMDQDELLEQYHAQGYRLPPRKLIKTQAQIEGIRRSGALTIEILDMVAGEIRPGITTNMINEWVHEYTIEKGGYPAPLNYRGFPKSVCTSINNVICHGIPDETVLKEGDIINVDVTTRLDGYYSDASRMFVIGSAPENAVRLVEVTKECLELGVLQSKAFGDLSDIGRVIEPFAKEKGYSVVRDLGGHGIGLQFHEEIHINHFETKGKGILLVPGLVYTIEPMINEGTYQCNILDDNWTVVTKDGLLSAQWEYTLCVTEKGPEILAY